LDTCLISELVKDTPNPAVVSWLDGTEESSLYLSVLTLGELQKGISKLAAGKKKQRIDVWFQTELRHRFSGRILDVSETVALVWGELQGEAEKRGRPLAAIDSLIAATAIANDMTVVTRNTADMQATAVRLFDPWAK